MKRMDLPPTERVLVRRFRADDAEAFAAYRSDPEVARYQFWEPEMPIEEAVETVRGYASAVEGEPGWFQYAVELRSEGVLIGDVGVNLHENRMQAELGYTFARAYQGFGYAREAATCVLDALFAGGLHKVDADCDARNLASAGLLERLGFRREGHRVLHTWYKGEWSDDLLFGLLAKDWRAAR
jgi:aminoglycoside 6'-N-acetyltransferase